ncbi:ABC transporter permease [Meiothermus ruber]|jgi:peptide/nickel transport system permease protein|uniref:Binding-protein-dependent transport system inner membrane protein n=1 Tax=Meiothermus ruber (strain ATCC 35948 / DSM 1279 / VKM B-1258 / 21) TaxID=504728 RepID=D3PSJ0_MEIRD|nr:ABC transporter permease [Meiothermus ruber]ADD28423.1 binding-protein-dependent transport systems inner membrane component [Meiothermus ruber DSM 1279]AGK06136.1 binding-protein-dependent transport system inner membrane protein [Meiothermus ruber DSM 1279]MCL6528972.1 ABC transporter permease [Meiothermus ruber]MCX8087866.1 ABC transporter permease [Meiothermus ruber]GAO75380.1 binding-protein-dependent transport system inner membrane protein [Meiothermus ruber H328]
MGIYLLRRVLVAIPTLWLISVLVFAVIQLQPGGFLENLLEDPRVSRETIENIRRQYLLDQPVWVQYLHWLGGIVRGDFGYSFLNSRPVSELIWERMGWTVFLAALTILATWVIAIPLGIYTALNRYGPSSTVLNFVGYFGLATPDFLVALLLIFLVLQSGGTAVGGLFSPQYIDAPWSWARFQDMLAHLWIPLIVIGLDGTATIMRQMRANLLDVLSQDYIRTARAKGLAERVVLWKHAVRNAINPLISLAGLQLPTLISSTIIASIVLSLPTIGPFLYDSLLNKDQYVVMALLMLSAVLLMVGNLLADVLLAWVDPRIRYE